MTHAQHGMIEMYLSEIEEEMANIRYDWQQPSGDIELAIKRIHSAAASLTCLNLRDYRDAA